MAGRPDLKDLTFTQMNLRAKEGAVRVQAGAGLVAGLIALAFGDLSADLVMDGLRWIVVVFVLGIFLTGFLIARTYVAYSNCTLVAEETLSQDAEWASRIGTRAASRSQSTAQSRAVREFYIARDAFHVTQVALLLTAAAYVGAITIR